MIDQTRRQAITEALATCLYAQAFNELSSSAMESLIEFVEGSEQVVTVLAELLGLDAAALDQQRAEQRAVARREHATTDVVDWS